MRKAQSAMEYLMTYGWAILIVVVVVAALYALGVFTPSTSRVACSPCFAGGDFAFVDYSSGTLILTSGPRTINIASITGNPDADGTPIGSTSIGTPVNPGSSVTVTGIDTTGRVVLTFTYVATASGLTHTDTATINN